jgi:hypothetical protein
MEDATMGSTFDIIRYLQKQLRTALFGLEAVQGLREAKERLLGTDLSWKIFHSFTGKTRRGQASPRMGRGHLTGIDSA